MASQAKKPSSTKKKAAPKKKRAAKRSVAQQLCDHRNKAAKDRQNQQKEIRNKFKGIEYVRQLELCSQEYEKLAKELEVAKIRKRETKGDMIKISILNSQIDLAKIRLDIIKGRIDLNIRRLKFCLPELKSIELTDPEGKNPMAGFVGVLREALQKHG